MLILLCRSVTPALSLVSAVENWEHLRQKLADPPRKRSLQRKHMRDFLS
jgi:hypothetical protein